MAATPKQELSLFDSTCIIVGIIIGAGIYETAPTVAQCLGSGAGIFGIWLLGGFWPWPGPCVMLNWPPPFPRRAATMFI